MYKVLCLDKISPVGTKRFGEAYTFSPEMENPQGILVRSASMHDMELGENLLAIARAGAGVNNIPVDACTEKGIVVFNTPGANANAVKELVLAGMLLASRDIIGGVAWVRDNADDENVGKAAEKAKRAEEFAKKSEAEAKKAAEAEAAAETAPEATAEEAAAVDALVEEAPAAE